MHDNTTNRLPGHRRVHDGNSSLWRFSAFGCFLFALLLAVPSVASAVWFDSSWQYRVKVEVNPTKVATTSAITNFPVYVDLAGMPSTFWSNVQADGDDIRVVESDEVTETPFELVSISTTTSKGELHFKADSLATTSTSTFYVYYGNPSASAYAVTDTYGRNNVWTMYTGVWHLGTTTDSTGNGYTLTNEGGVTFSTASNLGNAADFANNNTRRLRTNTNFGVTSAGTFSFKVLFKITSETAADDDMFWVGESTNPSFFVRGLYEHNGGSKRMRYFKQGSTATFLDASGGQGTNQWNQLVFNYDAGGMTLYVGTSSPVTATNTTSGTGFASAEDFQIGITEGGTAGFNGMMDEARFSLNTFSGAWVQTELNNHLSTSTFLFIGTQETDEATTTPQAVLQGGIMLQGGLILR